MKQKTIFSKILAVLLTLVMVFGVSPICDFKVSAATNPYGKYQTIDGITTVRCTWYAWQQAYDRTGIALPALGDGGQWYNNAKNKGLSVGTVARANSIAVWAGDSYGHVAYVVEVSGSKMTVNEGGQFVGNKVYGNEGVVNGATWSNIIGSSKTSGSNKKLIGFIYLTSDYPSTVTIESLANKNTIEETNAILWAQVNKPSSYAVTKIGIKVRKKNETYANGWSKYEAPSRNYVGDTYMRPYYNLNGELGLTLSPGTEYCYQFYAMVNGNECWGPEETFKTKGGHTHSYTEYIYYLASHPHYKCYKCSCGEVKENRNEPTFIDSCETCLNTVRPDKPVLNVSDGPFVENQNITFSWSQNDSKVTHYCLYFDVYDDNAGKYVGYDSSLRYVTPNIYKSFPVGKYLVRLLAYNSNHWEPDHSDWLHNTSETFYFTVNEDTLPGKPSLSITATDETKMTGFTWNGTKNTDHYDLRIWRSSDNENVLTMYNIKYTSYSYSLPAGDYVASVCSVDENINWTGSEKVNFTVNSLNYDFQPTGTAVFGNKIFAVFDNPVSYDYAKTVSEKMGGHLASIHNAEELKAVKKVCNSFAVAYWLGATDLETEGIWKWEDGTPWDYENWDKGEPNNGTYYGDGEHHLEIDAKTGFWNDKTQRYNSSLGFIAEFDIDDIKSSKSFQSQLNGHIYTLFKKCLPWEIAEVFCKNIYGHLATVTSKDENDLISSLATRGGKQCFIGGTDKNAEGIWQWIDTGEIFYHTTTGGVWVAEEPECYINWNEGEPNDYNFGEDYAIIFGNGSGLCNDYPDYTENLPYFICEQIISDGNGDGSIDSQDLTVLINSLLSNAEHLDVLDANGDGVLNIIDLIRLKKHLTNGTSLGKAEHPWSDWSEDNSLKDNSLYEVESKIQYAYSDKATTTSDSSSLSGWNYDYSTWTWGSYGSWSGWSTSSVSSDDYTDVDTSTLYKWYGFVCPYCGAHDPYNSGNCSGCNADKSTLKYTEFWSTNSWYNYTSYATRSTGTYRTKYTTSSNRYERWFSEWNTAPTTGYRYRTRNKIYTYHFYKWSEYSDWSDTTYTASDTRQVKIRTIYRYKLK